jgi:aminobutyraldehyde dehydrogenase
MQTQMLIGGRLLAGEAAPEQVLDAASGLGLASVASASAAQVDAAVAAAERATDGWAQTSRKDRAALLL